MKFYGDQYTIMKSMNIVLVKKCSAETIRCYLLYYFNHSCQNGLTVKVYNNGVNKLIFLYIHVKYKLLNRKGFSMEHIT